MPRNKQIYSWMWIIYRDEEMLALKVILKRVKLKRFLKKNLRDNCNITLKIKWRRI